MMNYYYLLKFNNYYNRLLKVRETIDEYVPYLVMEPFLANFNPNDEINTITEAINIADDNEADYLIIADEYNNLVSRWFILDRTRIRGNQWKFTLHRDVIADYYNVISQSPCFIEKSMLDYNSPLLFNKEDMTFNQIKSKEHLLKDKSRIPWLVGYYAADAKDLKGTVRTNDNKHDYSVIHIGDSFEDWKYYKYTNLAGANQEPFLGPAYNTKIYFIASVSGSGSGSYLFELNQSGQVDYKKLKNAYDDFEKVENLLGITHAYAFSKTPATIANDIKIYLKNYPGIFGEIDSASASSHSAAITEDFMWYAENLVADNNEFNIYQPQIKSLEEPFNRKFTLCTGSTYRGQSGMDMISFLNFLGGSPTGPAQIVCRYEASGYNMTMSAAISTEVRYDITGNPSRLITTDAPYNIFAIPYGEINAQLQDGTIFRCDPQVAMQVASTMIINHGGGNTPFIYDIQLLPYCPFPALIQDSKIVCNSTNQYSLIEDTSQAAEKRSIVINVPSSKIEFNINFKIPIGEDSIERKVNNECDKWRLCSPNFSDFFDFSAEMNAGVDFFNVDCEFKPYTPYIHVNPNFRNMYGADYNDPRGLVCGGDFSITQVTSAWTQYQIQNKNYEKIFGRQMQNMQVQAKASHIQTAAQAIAGTITGGTSGMVGGGIIGGGVGAGIGAAVGSAGAALTGIVDIQIDRMMNKEAMNYAQDLHAYELGNIQALPQTISKISSFNNNNKIFPVLEYYTCTDTEKDALRNKIKYNGMTTMVIGTLEDYLETPGAYVKGKVIRLLDLDGDYHLANEISKEMNLGIFVEGVE